MDKCRENFHIPYLCPMIDPATIAYVQAHLHDNPERLLLSAPHNGQVDIRFAVQQIKARRRVKDKLPAWYAHPRLVFPSALACEQASSEETARYKQRFLQQGASVIDGTGGLGVDSVSFSSMADKVVYIEQNESLCEAAAYNFNTLGLNNIEVRQGDCIEQLPALPSVDFIYMDPSRRDRRRQRLFALSDCVPNIVDIKEILLQKAPKVLVKVSPMADIRQSLRVLPEAAQIHVLSVKNECKELLFLLERPLKKPVPAEQVPISCAHIDTAGKEHLFVFCLGEEEATQTTYTDRPPVGYLYEPNSSLLKAGAFKLPASRFGLQKLHPHTHLYHALDLHDSFPGRIFHIKEVLHFNKQTIKTLHKTVPQANVAVRNFCMEAHELQKRLKIRDGGNIYLFGVSLSDQSYALVVTTKEN